MTILQSLIRIIQSQNIVIVRNINKITNNVMVVQFQEENYSIHPYYTSGRQNITFNKKYNKKLLIFSGFC